MDQPTPETPQSSLTYRSAGLDLDTYNQTVASLAPLLHRTHTPRVLDGFGGFASLFTLERAPRFARNYQNPVLIACTDGVGSKLKVAQRVGKHDTVGIDLVAMCVNDALCTGGEPLLFLDYIAMPRDNPTLTAELVKGISEGCLEAGCSLVGGETAILPESYAAEDYDLAGFCVGVVERDQIIDGRAICPGDVVLGLASTGLHSNGYSLARKVVFEHARLRVDLFVPQLGRTVGEELLEPTRIYVQPITQLLRQPSANLQAIRGLAHITGEGLEGNIPRVLPAGRRVFIRKGSWPIPAVYPWLQQLGNVAEEEMYRVFNMGIGFVVIVSPDHAESIQRQLQEGGVPTHVIGEVREGEKGVEWE